jgi:hypothetical protein
VPAMAMGRPTAAAVPMARRNGTLHQARNGMQRNAPPAASRLETPPMNAPAAKRPPGPGSSRVRWGRKSNRICVAA